MNSAIDYAKAQKRNGHIALGVTLAVIFGGILFTYLSSIGVVNNMSLLFVFGLATIALLFGISATLFYSRYKSIHDIIENPLVHWKYEKSTDEWLIEDEAEAIISEHGIYYSPAKDRVHNFWSIPSKLEALKIGKLPDYDYMTMNFFFIRAMTHEGNTISAAIHVPVPKGEEPTAEKLVDQLQQNMELNKVKRIKLLAGVALSFIAFITLLVILIRALEI